MPDTPQEQGIRAYVRSLASQLVPPSAPLLDSLALPPPPEDLQPFPTGHDERNIDFWDARTLREWDAERTRDDKWEMTRAQVDELREAHKAWREAVKQAKEEGQGVEGLPAPWTFPPRMRDDFVLSRSHERSWRTDMPAFDPLASVNSLVGAPPHGVLPDVDDALLAMGAVPALDEAFDLKLSATAEQVAEVKRIRSDYTSRKRLDEYALQDEQDWSKELARMPPSSVPRLGSPPIFPRSSAQSVHRSAPPGEDPFTGLLPSEGSAYPSSPRGKGISQEQWNREEGLTSLPDSSPAGASTDPAKSAAIWSSSPSKVTPPETLTIEPPRFDRVSQAALPAVPQLDAIRLAELLREDDPETDQLEASDEGDMLPAGASARPGGTYPAFSSDDTLGEPDAGVDDVAAVKHFKPPAVPDPSTVFPAPSLPPLSAFASRAATSTSASSPWSLKPLPGLKALTLGLSWQAWKLDEGETLEDVLLGGQEGEEEEAVRALASGEDGSGEDGSGAEVGKEEEEELWSLGAFEGCVLDGPDDDAELLPRVTVAGDAATVEGACTPQEEPVAERMLVDELDTSSAPLHTFTRCTTSGAVPEVVAPLSSLPSHDAVAAPPLAPDDAARQPPMRGPTTASEALTSESSDFGFVFPTASAPPSPPAPRDIASSQTALDPEPRDGLFCETQGGERLQAVPTDEDVAAVGSIVRLDQGEALRPSWSNAAALDRFLFMRGVAPPHAPASSVPALEAAPVAAEVEPALAPAPHSSPPPGSIPFSVPPFLADSTATPFSLSSPIRVVAFDALHQMRAHLAALRHQGLVPVHRTSRYTPQPYRTYEPHLIVDPRSAVLFLRLDGIVGNAVPRETSQGRRLTRPEPVMTTLTRLHERFDRLLVVLEEPLQRVGGVKNYGYTLPVLTALQQLASGLSELAGKPHGVEVALSKGAEHSGELVRRWVRWLAGKDDVASREEGLPVLELWGERAWLSEDPSQDEVTLLDLDGLNELAACAVLGVCSASEFVALSTEDRVAIFARLVGTATVDRISRFLSTAQPTTTSPRSCNDSDCGPPVSLSQLGGALKNAPASSGGSSGEWRQWIHLDL